MTVILVDFRSRRGQRTSAATGTPGQVRSIFQLSPQVQLRQLQREAARELAYLNFLLGLTRGEPGMVPSLAQMQAIVDGTIEF